MLHRKAFLLAFLLGLGCCLLAGIEAGAGEKKQDDKKKAGPVSKFVGKTVELKLADGKVKREAEFDQDDPKAFGQFHYKVYTVQLEKGKTYKIDHRGSGGDPKFDPYLFLEDPAGNQLEADDDSGGGFDSRIIYKVAKAGQYRIIATTFVAGQTGKFTLEISPPSAAEARAADLMFRANGFAALSGAQRKDLVNEIQKHLRGQNGDLTFLDFRIANQAATEAEIEGNIDLARSVLEESVKQFAAAKGEQITGLTGPLENALKSLDKIGKEFEISGKTLAGKDFDLKNMKGKVVLVDFWGTWCPPCVAEIPNIISAYEKYHGKGFDVIGVTRPAKDQDDTGVSDFLKKRKMPWTCINIEDSAKLIEKHAVTSYPNPILIGRDGRIVSARARGPQLDRLLERLLKEKK